jgi:hypothetical protein
MWTQNRSGKRSEVIRNRLSKKIHQGGFSKDRRKRKMNARHLEHSPPPVMARYTMKSVSQVERKRSKIFRHRYDIAINGQGAEISFPALPRLRIGWRIISFTLVAGLAVALYQLWNLPMFSVTQANVQGIKLISSAEVNTALGLIGAPVFTLNPAKMEEILTKAFPEFSNVLVKVELPNKVIVRVTERVPVLLWRQGDHAELVDSSGMAFTLRNDMAGIDLLIIDAEGGPSILDAPLPAIKPTSSPNQPDKTLLELPSQSGARPLLTSEMVKAIILVASQAPQGAPLLYSPQHGLGWKDNRGWSVYLGNTQDMEMKLLVYQGILNGLQANEIVPALISVESVHAPFYRLE